MVILLSMMKMYGNRTVTLFFFFLLVCSWQPKLIINNVDVLRNASLSDDGTSVCGSMYHDSLVWRIIALGANERCLPVILVTSDR